MFNCLPIIKDRSWLVRLVVFSPIFLLLLPIGQCIAQNASLKTNLVGMKRRHVQVIMRPYSFTEYRKDYVTYIVQPGVLQTVNYNADTCSSFSFSLNTEMSEGFQKELNKQAGETLKKWYSVHIENDKTLITFAKTPKLSKNKKLVVDNSKLKHNKKRPKRKPRVVKNKSLMIKSTASDERYFTGSGKQSVDSSGIKVLGWRIN